MFLILALIHFWSLFPTSVFFSFKMFWSHSNQLFICSTLNSKNAKNRTNFKVWRPIRLNFVYLLLFFCFRIMRTIEIVNVTLIWLNVEFFYLYRSINLFFKCIKFFPEINSLLFQHFFFFLEVFQEARMGKRPPLNFLSKFFFPFSLFLSFH